MSGKISNSVFTSDHSEKFGKSTCVCNFCTSTHVAVGEWSSFVPETHLQKNMVNTISKIEERENKVIQVVTSVRRSPRLIGLSFPAL